MGFSKIVMGVYCSTCGQNLRELADSSTDFVVITGNDSVKWVEVELGISIAEDVVGAVPVVKDIYKALKSIYTKYTEHQDMKKWLSRLAQDVQMTAEQASKLPQGTTERTMLELALEEAKDLLEEFANGVGAYWNAKDIQQTILDIKEHLHQRKSSAHFGHQQTTDKEMQRQIQNIKEQVHQLSDQSKMNGKGAPSHNGLDCSKCDRGACGPCPNMKVGLFKAGIGYCDAKPSLNGSEVLRLRRAGEHEQLADLCLEWITLEPDEPYPKIQLAIAFNDLHEKGGKCNKKRVHEVCDSLIRHFGGFHKMPEAMQTTMRNLRHPAAL